MNWNINEIIGNQYLYVSKSGNDTLAANYFGKAAAWVSGGSYAIGDRVTSSSIQYKNLTGVNTTTAPASDATNWGFDFENFQTYNTGKSYLVGHKTNYNNEHYVCNTNTSGTFDVAKWTKVVVSNQSAPFLYLNSAINLVNSDARFVSQLNSVSDNFDYTAKVKVLLSNGNWNEIISAPICYVEIIGQSNQHTLISLLPSDLSKINLKNCFISTSTTKAFSLLYNCIITNPITISQAIVYKNNIFTHADLVNFLTLNFALINNYIAFDSMSTVTSTATKVINNYFVKSQQYIITNACTIDYNCYKAGLLWNGATKSTQSAIRAADSNYNQHSIVATENFNNPTKYDYTVAAGSPLIGAGKFGGTIGAFNKCVKYDGATLAFTAAGGAVLYNVIKDALTSDLKREQVAKNAQAGAAATITLEAGASATNDIYNGLRIRISTGTGSGQTRTISDYDGTTKVATVSVNWDTNPDATSVYSIIDGILETADIDLGGMKPMYRFNLFSEQIVDSNGKLTKSLFDSIVGNDYTSEFEMKYAASQGDLAGATYKRFKYGQPLTIDSSARGNAQSGYVIGQAQNIPFARWFKFRILFSEL